jgi:hypothetical protein
MIDKNLGYYLCDGIEFGSKIQACLHSVKVNKPIKWVFLNSFFEKNDWKTEPVETLDMLYNQRARQIREKYDYVILSYSGGADSHNILMSFIRQGLHIDEIIVNTMTKGNSQFTVVDSRVKTPEHAASEHQLQTIPRLKEVENLIPRTKITILDLSDHLFSSLTSAKDASWVLDKREGLNPLGATRFNYIHFTEVRKQFDKDKKIALVLGIEKPRTWISSDDNLYIRFTDRATNLVTVAEYYQEYTNSRVEYFYWNKESLRLLTKQAHVIKHWLEAFPQYQHLWRGKNVTPEVFRIVHERLLRSLLYTTWNDSWFQSDKATKDWYSEFDDWFIKGHEGSQAHNIWREGLDFVESNLTPYIKKDKTGQSDGLTSISYDYLVGRINISKG